MDGVETTERDLGDTEGTEIDLADRLRFAADALASDFAGEISPDQAEALVFSSAEGLLASASVTEFVPILAERRARLAVRAGGTAPPVPALPEPSPAPETPPPAPVASPAIEEPVPKTAAPSAPVAAIAGREPLLAVPGEELSRLRNGVEQLRRRLADWQAELARR